MKQLNIVLIFVLVLTVTFPASAAPQELEEFQPPRETTRDDQMKETAAAAPDIELGSLRIPRPFIHATKNYEPGIYSVTVTEKEGVPYFNVYNPKQELLFEEMAVVKPGKKRYKGSKSRVKKGFIDNYEYFKLNVIKADRQIMAFFMVKK